MIKQFHGNKARLRRHQRMRRYLEGTSARPRLSVYRSGSHIYAQIIDDTTGKTLVAASSLDESLRGFKPTPSEPSLQEKMGGVVSSVTDAVSSVVEMATELIPGKGKGAKAEKQPQKAPVKGGQQKGT